MMRHIDRELSAAAPAAARTRTVIENVSRRGFLKGSAAFALAVQFLPETAQAFVAYKHGGLEMPNGVVNNPLVFVSIARDGSVTIVAHRSEMGTGSRTSIPMVIADELEADWARVEIVQAEGDEKKYGNQDTDGSRSLRHHIQPAREIGAAMRLMLEQAAAQRWQTDVANVQAVNHEVIHKSLGTRLGYGELAEAAMALPVPPRADLPFKDEKEFRYIGKGQVQIVDLHDITVGKAVYGADVRLPGMLVAVVARPPSVGGKVKTYDASAAMAVPGVVKVTEIPGYPMGSKFKPLGGVAVVAKNTWAAIKGRDALTIEWDAGPHGSASTAKQEQAMRASAANPGDPVRNQGDAEAALASAAKVFTREYYQPHMAHAPMEPPASLVSVKDGKCEIWACVQSPYGTRLDVADFLGMKEEDVRVNVTLLGGGFGRKSKCDFVMEAAYLSREVGAPVRVQWTREDDIRHCFYHTTSVEKIDIGLDAGDKPVAWRHRSAATSILSTFAPDEGVQLGIEIGMGLEDMPYEIANVRAEQCRAYAETRVGWFRSVSNIPRAFAIQSITAELAHELGRDQKDFLLEMIGSPRKLDWQAAGLKQPFWNNGEPNDEFPIDTGRLRNVVELAAREGGWGRSLPEGEGLGIAVHRSFVTYIATLVRVKVDGDGNLTVPEAHVAIDCGFVANPERVRSQMQGACVFGMTAAMYGGITIEDGAVQESNFHDYQMVRASAFPQTVYTHIVEYPFSVHATGVGEPGVPPFLPALTNAIFNATGKRIRNLPIGDQLKA